MDTGTSSVTACERGTGAGYWRGLWLILTFIIPLLVLVSFLRILPAAALGKGPDAFISSAPRLVINEVAWGGTAAEQGQYDEWIELYNRTAQTITLEGWTLAAIDGIPVISLEGEIGPYGLAVLERQDDQTISDRPADQIYSGVLENAGETLELRDPSGVLVDSANLDEGGWPAGSGSPGFYSMERIDPSRPDNPDNWAGNDGAFRNGLDADGNPVNGTPGAWNSAGVLSDLWVLKQGPASALPGALVSYTIWVGNSGLLTATNVVVTDSLPAGLELVGATEVYSHSNTGSLLIWKVGELVPEGEVSITATARLEPDAAGAVTNLVEASTGSPERNLAQNRAAWTTRVGDPAVLADLAVSKSGPHQAAVGQTVVFTVSLINNGALTATNVILTDSLPAGVSFIGQSSAYSFTQKPGGVVWNVNELPPGEEPITFSIKALVGEDAADLITNSVTVSSPTPEANPDDNRAIVDVPVLHVPIVRLTAVHYYALQTGDEAVRLANLGIDPVDLVGWKLSDNEQSAVFPSGVVLQPGKSIWVARKASDFYAQFGYLPDLEMDGSEPTVPGMMGSWPLLANDGDEVVLLDDAGQVQDVLVYLDGNTSQEGWSGSPVAPYHPGAFSQQGQILYLKLDQRTGRPVPDTNTAADWAQELGDPVNGRKVLYPGWDLETFFLPLQITTTARLTVAIGPDHLFEVVSDTLGAAQDQLLIQSYTFENTELARVVAERAAAGVSVTLLLEGSPAGEGITDQERWVCREIETHGGRCLFMISDEGNKIHDRYRYQHAKFMVIDHRIVMIGSENPSPDAMPADEKGDGTAGRRGVYLITDAPEIVTHLETMFRLDADLENHKDIAGFELVGPPPEGFTPVTATNRITYSVFAAVPLAVQGEMVFEVVQSPENALRDQGGLLGLLARAGPGDRVMVEQMHEPLHWGNGDSNPANDPNLRLEGYLAAARRGADVRVLLDEFFGSTEADNREPCAYLNAWAKEEGLRLKCALANPSGMGIHNKMVLAGIGGKGYVHVGSINGSELSNKGNREVALQVQSDQAFTFLAEVFERDWPDVVYLPLVCSAFIGPAGYPLISEVLYNPSGGQDNAREWVELYNPTGRAFDLGNWLLGDAVDPDDYEATYQFPPGAGILPGETLVVAVNAQRFYEEYGQYPDYEIWGRVPAVPDLVRYKGWGDGDFALGNAGDEVILYDHNRKPVDVLSWGTGQYPGVIPHPGVQAGNHSLERFPPWRDTDDCSFDFWERPSPGPGEVEG